MEVDNLTANGSVVLQLGDGEDRVRVNQTLGLNGLIGGNLDVRMGIGDDSMLIDNFTVRGNVAINGSDGRDTATDTMAPSLTVRGRTQLKSVESTNIPQS